jgi:hypothetical protein
MRSWWRIVAWSGGGAWLAACAAEANIGADACPRGAKCEVQQIALPLESIEVHSTGRPTLEPIWKTSQLQLESDAMAKVYPHAELAAGPDGGVWLFTPEPGQLGVTLLDANAIVVARFGVKPPPGLPTKADSIPYPNVVQSHPDGPVVGMQWLRDCEALLAREPNAACHSQLTEVLVFGGEADQPRRLLPFAAERRTDDSLNSLHRSADGDALLVSSNYLEGVRKLDLDGKVLWRSSLSLAQFDELPNRRTRMTSANLFGSGVVTPNGDLVASIDIQETKAEGGGSAHFPSGLLHIAADGARSVRLYEGWEHADARYPIGETFGSYPHAMLAYDAYERLVVVHPMLDGDLLVLRIGESGGERFRILREDYADLRLHDIATDPAGTVYIATEGGGREPGSELPLLCRVPADGEPECFTLPGLTFDIEAPAPGVVFALMYRTEELARFDLP